MLVLSRKAGESIQIGDDIVVTITRIQGNRIQIGIDAPRDVSIRRSELNDPPTRGDASSSSHGEGHKDEVAPDKRAGKSCLDNEHRQDNHSSAKPSSPRSPQRTLASTSSSEKKSCSLLATSGVGGIESVNRLRRFFDESV